ncbi:MAG TPA: hypothetical protein VEG38_08755 [Acidimicrobiia bacterium]|nr:hypothetical protein [Acidimicrobiia bacterium]
MIDVIRAFPAPARQALYAAATSGTLRRGTWDGCPLNRAGEHLGVPVRSRGEAAYVLGVSPETARRFVEAWDRLWGSNRRRSKMLRDALVRVARSVDDRPLDGGTGWVRTRGSRRTTAAFVAGSKSAAGNPSPSRELDPGKIPVS